MQAMSRKQDCIALRVVPRQMSPNVSPVLLLGRRARGEVKGRLRGCSEVRAAVKEVKAARGMSPGGGGLGGAH